jgi:phosphoglucomutase
VLAANGIDVRIAKGNEFTPTPVLSHAILTYNDGRSLGLADGIIITPSHNPPADGGYKYNPPDGGPASKEITDVVQNRANAFLKNKLSGVKRIPYERALKAETTHLHDFVMPYVSDLKNVLDLDLIKNSGLKLAVDPMGGAGVNFWQAIADHYKINLSILNPNVDPTFSFMTCDWDGKIRMDPSSPFAMQSVIEKVKSYDVAFACDTDHDRHGIVTPDQGLMPSNPYLATMIYYLFTNRSEWSKKIQIGKTVVSSSMIDRVAKLVGNSVYEVPVGFKWFVDGLMDGSLGFVGEESAGATFLRRNGKVWTTDKDGIIAALLSAEMTAKLQKNPAAIYAELTAKLGNSSYKRVEAKADAAKREKLKKIKPEQIKSTELAGEKITRILTTAPGNQASIGGLKVETENAWFATRPSGTEDIYKIYAESFISDDHLQKVLAEAQSIVDQAID